MPPIENPILNSPFREPTRHHTLDERGSPTGEIVTERRKSTYLTPVPLPRRQRGQAQQLDLFPGTAEQVEENQTINNIRLAVARWRASKWPHVTRTTHMLLTHWADPKRERRLFFCQIEALETVIYITEAAKREKQPWIESELRTIADQANPGLYRIAFKMATGSGKTVVMAMLIAWHTLNRLANPGDARFSDAFLIVTPGVTIRDRLRVLLPTEPDNYYRQRDIVPAAAYTQLFRARIVITNYHAFIPRQIVEASALTKKLITSRSETDPFTETPGGMVRRVCRGLGDAKNILVLNDEAHHCFARRQDSTEKIAAEDRDDAEAARVWVGGLQAVAAKIGVKAVYDLSATPFFLNGSGYQPGKLFPWVVSDFALIDAIESGIVKIPRLPVADNAMQGDMPMYRSLWESIRDSLPKRADADASPDRMPTELTGALFTLYGSYQQVYALWREQVAALPPDAVPPAPPVFIVVCNNTRVSKMVFDWIAGCERPYGGSMQIQAGKLDLFRNEDGDRWHARPTTILVDSRQLDSGEAIADDFRRAAAREIDAYKADYRRRFPDRDPDALADSDLLREVMNTVGKPGTLGESVRCVVSVSMLTEGWDVGGVTHILGVRAFGTQLLCEQVVGRALRRVSYVPDEDGMFDPEYAEVFGVPFSFIPVSGTTRNPRLARTPTRVYALPERAGAAFRFPNVVGYRYDLADAPLATQFDETSHMTLSSEQVATYTENAPLIGPSIIHTLDGLYARRAQEVVFLLAQIVLERGFRDGDAPDAAPKVWYYPQLLPIVRAWMRDYLTCKDECQPQLLLLESFAGIAAEKIYRAIIAGTAGRERLQLVLDPAAPIGSSSTIDFETRRNTWRTDPAKCQVNYVPIDSGWEDKMAQVLEMMPEVTAYVKNEGMNLSIPYTHEGRERRYIPDFIARIDRGPGRPPLNLVIEVTGIVSEEKEAKRGTMDALWIPGVNALAAQAYPDMGEWSHIEILDPWNARTALRDHISRTRT